MALPQIQVDYPTPATPFTSQPLDHISLKSRINLILPIVLSLILPGLGILSNVGTAIPENIGTVKGWLLSSSWLYALWYLLWNLWDIRYKQANWWIVLGLFVGIVGSVLLPFWVTPDQVVGFKWFSLFRLLLAIILFLSIQYALKTQENISRLQVEKEQIQTENYRVQLKALRAQVDPHFLFNSLNTLRSMVRHQHSHAERFIISLSDLYRQTLRYNENATLALSGELAVLESYLFLMKNRNEEAVQADVQIGPELLGRQLPTLSLQLVVENCFKHNSMSSKNPLYIKIQQVDQAYIMISNNLQPKIVNQLSSGYGLDLLRKRYELMNVQEGVLIERTPTHFHVKLKLI